MPRDSLIVITGLSGSGKSSLAFDTIYAEGQRRYVESLSAYARQFLEMMQKPDVDQIDGPVAGDLDRAEDDVAQPALDRRHGHRDLRLPAPALRARRHALFAGDRPADREPDRHARWSTGSWRCRRARGSICSRPIVRGRKGEYRKELAELQKKGFQRVKIDGKFHEIDEAPAARQEAQARYRGRGRPHRRAARPRQPAGRFVRDRARACRRHRDRRIRRRPKVTDGKANKPTNETHERLSSRRNSPARCRASPSPRSSRGCSRSTIPFGACPACDGLGTKLHVRPRPRRARRSADACARARSRRGRKTGSSPYYLQTLEALARHFKFSA